MKNLILSTLTATLLLSSSLLGVESQASSSSVTKKAIQKATHDAKESKLIKEALNSLKLASSALVKLQKNKSAEAKKDIELALGKLESTLVAKDAPKLLPIDQRVVVKNYVGSVDDIEKALKQVGKLLREKRVQEAQTLLSTLQSEIEVTVVNLPLVTYPDALKLASKFIIEDKPQKAQEVLKVALNSFSEVVEIIPLPIINALKLIDVAKAVSKDDKSEALKYLSSANDELKKAELLGYISESATTYKELHKLIDSVKEEIKGKNKAEKMFENLGKKLNEFKSKIFS
ncbi:MAG: YfdX family protein [Epsilonproteobacteria bacterium]|nr:YfdX family protein [Campylobacterota bacterium]